ncbi:hypothetical protein ACEWY4_025635 [Coilia grayii]|uniref:RNA-directed DNA polymerase from mobile element jockey n=1 Tax=Coilia grayii TaxID=363190 RepID=A0ABD1IUN4_9TELE
MKDFNLVCLNDGHPTRVQLGGLTPSCLDLMIVSGELAGKGKWEVLDPYNLGSDHFPTVGIFGLRFPVELDRVGGRFNFLKADWGNFEVLCDDLLPGLVDSSVDEWSNGLSCLMLSAAASAIPIKGMGRQKKMVHWWNKECDEAIRKRNRAFRALRRFPTPDNLVQYKYYRALVRRVIKSAKRSSWRVFCSSLSGETPISQLWATVRKMNGVGRKVNLPVLVYEGGMAVTPVEKANILVETFRKVHSSDNLDKLSRETRDQSAGEVVFPQEPGCNEANVFFSLEELKRAIAAGRHTAPGLDNLHYEMFNHVSDVFLEELLSLMNESWKVGRLPKAWKHAVIVPVLKPGKDPSSPSSYRPIALTSVMCKLMERMVTDRLVHFLEVKGALVDHQSGFRKGRGTMDNIVALDCEIKRAFANKESLIAVFLDIERAYDMPWREGLLVKLLRYGVNGNLFSWIKNFLEDCTIQVRVGDVMSAAVLVENGTPQGSVISPVLFNVMINDVFLDLNQGTGKSLFADDGALWVKGRNIPFILRRLQEELNVVEKWARKWGFKSSVSKSKFVFFSRTRKKWDMSLTLYGSHIERVECFKYLGVWFDSKLNWNIHISKVIAKTNKVINVMRCLTGYSWGAEKGTLLTIYQAMIRSIFDYGCQAYGAASSSVLKRLDVIQSKALRVCCGAFASTSTSALLVETGEKPLRLRRIQLALHYWNRLRERISTCPASSILSDCYEFTSEVSGQPFLKQCMSWAKDFNLLDMVPVKSTFWGPVPVWLLHPVQVDLRLHEDKHNEDVDFSSESAAEYIQFKWNSCLQIYTDGSKDPESGRVSCAFCIPQLNVKNGYRLNDNMAVFTAESMGILKALQWVVEAQAKDVVLCTDSFSLLQCLKSCSSNARPDLIAGILLLLNSLYLSGCDVSFLWVPAHVGIKGNEIADKLAKEYLNKDVVMLPVGPGRTELRSQLMGNIFKTWQAEWDKDLKGRHLYSIQPSVNALCTLSGDRSRQVVLTRLRLGHCGLNSTLHLIHKHRDGLCEVCRVPETVSHVLLECVQYCEFRRLLFSELSKIGVTTVSLHSLLQLKDSKVASSLVRFLKSSGVFARI